MIRTFLVCALIVGTCLPAGCASQSKTSQEIQSGQIKSFDGVDLVFDAQGRGRPALMFVHGWCCNRTQWEHQVAEFKRDHRVVAIDLAGHGESGDDRHAWTLQNFARDIEAVVIEQELGAVILIGHSMGGPVCAMAAARIPDRVIGVVGVDTLHNAEFEFPPGMVEQFAAAFETDLPSSMQQFIGAMDPESLGADPTVVARIVQDAVQNEPDMAAALMRHFGTVDMKQVLAECPVPIYCINAAAPNPTVIEINREYRPDFDAVLMEGVNHWPHLEKPAEFNRLLRAQIESFQ